MMRQNKVIYAMVIATIAWCLAIGLSADESSALRIIVHKENPSTSINVNILKKIYLGKRTIWPHDKPIVLVALKSGKVHNHFLKYVVKQNSQKFNLYWKKARFTGTGVAPKTFSSEEEVKKFVSTHPEAIGYISQAKLDDTVKRIPIK